MRYRIAAPSLCMFVEEGFEPLRSLVRRKGAAAGLNLGFFGTAPGKPHPLYSAPVGQLVLEGREIRKTVSDSRHFHALQSKGGRIFIDKEIHTGADWGIGMGPRLVEHGEISDNLYDSRWQAGGIMLKSARERVAVGVFPDGRVIGATCDAALPAEMAVRMLQMGVSDAIACDGGSSRAFVDLEAGIDLGGSKENPNALLFMPGPGDSDSLPDPPGKRTVVIDPGHGRETDPGAVAPGLSMIEADITLQISHRLRYYLQNAGYRTVLTHEIPRDLRPGASSSVELQARSDVGNNEAAALFISIHVDSFSKESVRGIRLHRWPTSSRGLAIAKTIADTIRPLALVAGVSAKCMDSYFHVLGHTWMPAVLVECGYLTNNEDRTLLFQASYRDKIALALAIGVSQSDRQGLF